VEQKSNKHVILVTSMIYFAVIIFVSVLFYNIMPTVLNYPEGTVGGTFQQELEGVVYSLQYAGITIAILVVSFVMICMRLRKLLRKDIDLEAIRKIYLEAPQKIYVSMILVGSISIIIIHALSIKAISITTFKIWIFFFSSITISCALAYILTKGFFTKELTKLNLPNKPQTKRVGIRKEIYMETIPIFMSAILFTALVGYTRIVNEKGEVLSKVYLERIEHVLDKEEYESFNEIRAQLSNVKLEDPEDKIYFYNINTANSFGIDSNEIKLSDYFKKYLIEKSQEDNRVYDYYGVDIQGVAKKVSIGNNDYYIGVIYYIKSVQALKFLIFTFVGAFLTNILVIYVFAKTLSDDITLVTDKLNELSDNENVDLNKKLPITSNNEIGDLVSSFNTILDLEKEQVEQIKNSQNAMIEQERLATLGQLAGGMAHDINTPLSTITQAISYFEEFEKFENEDSERMLRVTKISAEKIGKIVNSVRDQIRNIGSEKITNFSLKEVVKNVELLLFSELKKTNSILEISGEDILINGDMNKLEQVVMNFIINSLQAYEELGKKNEKVVVDISIKDNEAVIAISDNAGGLPQKIADSMFKQILTTKGTKGTGFGLYFSNSIIKAVFNGRIEFVTEEGIGTTFYIILPIK